MPPLSRALLALVAVTAAAPAALAEPPEATAVADARPLSVRSREGDAAAGRGVLSTHAETVGAGRVRVDATNLALIGVGWGVSEDLEAGVNVGLPVLGDTWFAGASVKGVIARRRSLVVALRAAVDYGAIGFESGLGDGSVGFAMASVGLAADHYLDGAGVVSLHEGVVLSGVFPRGGGDVGLLARVEAGATARVTSWLALQLEAIVPIALTAGDDDDAFAVVVNYGARLHWASFALDLGFVKPLGDDVGLAIGAPCVTLA
ncbi:MAG: hypothetical protein KC635_01315 [Myxococcales bacterium]|nr:hypothetical protein [Myxococcales bacterium]